jgi:hypothetical protein
MSETRRERFSILGLGAAACIACCAGPILAFLGSVSVAGIASTWLIGSTGLVISALAGAAFLFVRRRQRTADGIAPTEPVLVELTSRNVTR